MLSPLQSGQGLCYAARPLPSPHNACPSWQNPIVPLLVFPTQGPVPVEGCGRGDVHPAGRPLRASAGATLPLLAVQGRSPGKGPPQVRVPLPSSRAHRLPRHGPDPEPVGTLSPPTQVGPGQARFEVFPVPRALCTQAAQPLPPHSHRPSQQEHATLVPASLSVGQPGLQEHPLGVTAVRLLQPLHVLGQHHEHHVSPSHVVPVGQSSATCWGAMSCPGPRCTEPGAGSEPAGPPAVSLKPPLLWGLRSVLPAANRPGLLLTRGPPSAAAEAHTCPKEPSPAPSPRPGCPRRDVGGGMWHSPGPVGLSHQGGQNVRVFSLR